MAGFSRLKTRNEGGHDTMSGFLSRMAKIPLLTHEEEIKLSRQIQHWRPIALAEAQLLKAKKPATQGAVLELIRDAIAQGGDIELSLCPEKNPTSWAKWVTDDGAMNSTVDYVFVSRAGLRARQRMMETNIRLVVSIARKFSNRGLEFEDLIQEGGIGLSSAADKFEPAKGWKFSTYAYWWIRQGMARAIHNDSRLMRLPIHACELLQSWQKVAEEYKRKEGDYPTVAQAMAIMYPDDPAKQGRQAAKIIELRVLAATPTSLDAPVSGGSNDSEPSSFGDFVESPLPGPEESLEIEAMRAALDDILQILTTQERRIIEVRKAPEGGVRPISLKKLGEEFGVSRERIRQIEAAALRKLTRRRESPRLRAYAELVR
jgi:RNA polymerase sigma factor (sigma-70 family)